MNSADEAAYVALSRNDFLWIGAIILIWVFAGADVVSPRLPGDNVAILWLPNAVLAAAMLRRLDKPRVLAAFAAAAIGAATIPGALRTGEGALGWATLAIANCLEAYTLAWLANRFGGPTFHFHRARNVVIWTGAALLACSGSMVLAWIATLNGLSPLDFTHWSTAAARWILGNASAHVTLGALLVEFTAPGVWRRVTRAFFPRGRLPWAVGGAVLVSSVLAFAGPRLWDPQDLNAHPGYLALILPALMWAAFSYGPAAAAASSLVALGAGIALSVSGWGPFARKSAEFSGDLQIMILALSGATLLIGALGAYVRNARDAAATADRLKTLFLSRVGHELRTPLNGVIGAADLLARELEEQADEAHLERIDLVRSSARTLAAVVEDLVEYSTLQREGVSVRLSTFEVARPFNDAIAIFEPQARWNNVALLLTAPSLEGRWVTTDPARVRQILFALVANATAVTTKGSIAIAADLDEKNGPMLRFSVRDTGGGVSEDLVPHIFEPFVQGARTPGSPASGLGLGLAVARDTSEALGGSIRLENAPGLGATFHVSVPVEIEEQPNIERAGRRVTALLAEDNPTNRIVLSAMLTSLGFDVMTVGTGAEALAAVEKRDFALVLMDIQMPEMDGEEAIERIRALDGARARTPIIAVTAHALAGDAKRFEAAGADGVLNKPVALKDLAASVARALG